MNPATQDIARLQKLDRKLKLVGIINIGLLVVLIVCTVVMHSQMAALVNKDPNNPEVSQGIQKMHQEVRLAIAFGFVCGGLMLLWMPARAICLFKLKKLKDDSTATS